MADKDDLPGSNLSRDQAFERLLTELVKYYRLSAIGRRTSGIIHNLNTPLQALIMQMELVKRKLAAEAEFASRLPADLYEEWRQFQDYREQKNRQLQEQVAHIQRLVDWIRYQGFHENSQGPQEIDLNQMIYQELEGYLAEAFFKHRVAKKFSLGEKLPPIRGFYIDFSQSFRNLVDNALEALQEVAAPILTIATQRDSNRRLIIITDNGPGIRRQSRPGSFNRFAPPKIKGPNPTPGWASSWPSAYWPPTVAGFRLPAGPGIPAAR